MTDSNAEVSRPPELEEFIKANHKKKFQFGIIAALLCAIYWGVWYVPGYAIWVMPDFLPQLEVNIVESGHGSYDAINELFSDDVCLEACVLLCLVNAIIDTVILFIWNGAL